MRESLSTAPPRLKAISRRSRKIPRATAFKAYLAAKTALERLFHKKCAYCEFKYKAGLTGDVEHYRPKGRFLTSDGKTIWPGYYWLAATWTNLVPVCSMCNRTNVVIDPTDGTRTDDRKGERFPLADESRRAKPERSRRR